MKPAATLSLVVISVLATVVIEEHRIKELRRELLDLRALRAATPEEAAAASVAETPLDEPLDTLPRRVLPADFPQPSSEQLTELANSDLSDLYQKLELSRIEQAYVESVILRLRRDQQALIGAWMNAEPDARGEIEAKLNNNEAEAEATLREFLGKPEEIAALQEALSMQADRQLYQQLVPYLSVQGVQFDPTTRDQFIQALHRIRVTVDGVDWNSAQALPFFATGAAKDRFQAEWQKIDDGLKSVLPVFLDAVEMEAVSKARAELFTAWKTSLFGEDEPVELPEGEPAPAAEESAAPEE